MYTSLHDATLNQLRINNDLCREDVPQGFGLIVTRTPWWPNHLFNLQESIFAQIYDTLEGDGNPDREMCYLATELNGMKGNVSCLFCML